MIPKPSIELFLKLLKQYVEKNGLIIVPRDSTNQFMMDRGMAPDGLREIILSLEPSDCFDGPEPDRDPRFSENWTVAEFSPQYSGELLYLKVSIRVEIERAKCL